MLQQILQEIPPVDAGKSRQAQEAWDNIAKPLHSLGKLEDLVCQMAGIYRTLDFSIAKKICMAYNICEGARYYGAYSKKKKCCRFCICH